MDTIKVTDVIEEGSLLDLVIEGLYIDGGHHKQWYLQQIASKLGINFSEEWLEEYGEPEEGIPA